MNQMKLCGIALMLCVQCGSIFACPQAEFIAENGTVIRLEQRKFDHVYELVLLAGNKAQEELKSRLTYDGTANPACRFGAVAIAQGGKWGWHLAWADETNVYVTRMDGDAWVNVPPKRFAVDHINALTFVLRNDVLQLTASNPKTSIILNSEDEGRSWSTKQ